jgi:hypothetical protein
LLAAGNPSLLDPSETGKASVASAE